MFYNMLIRSLDRNPQNSGEVFQNAENRVWGRFQNVRKNIQPWSLMIAFFETENYA